MRITQTIAVAAALLIGSSAANAATILSFEKINKTYPSTTYAQILNFYNGGTSSDGTSGPNVGISFSADAVAVCMNALGGTCSNASRNGTSPTSGEGGLGMKTGAATMYLDFTAPYTGFIAFRYQVTGFPVSIQAFDGPGGSGTALTSALILTPTAGPCPAYNALMCNLGPGGLGSVTNARSVVFVGLPGHFVFDDLTFGAGNDPLDPPADTPEPATWAMLVLGFGAVGAVLRRRRAVSA